MLTEDHFIEEILQKFEISKIILSSLRDQSSQDKYAANDGQPIISMENIIKVSRLLQKEEELELRKEELDLKKEQFVPIEDERLL